MFVEEPAVPAAHVAIADHPSFADPNSTQILEAIHEPAFVDPVWEGPMFGRNHFVIALRRGEVLSSLLSQCQIGWDLATTGLTLNSSLNGSSLKKIHGY